MSNETLLTSLQNPKVKETVRLRQQRRSRDERKEYIIEGYRELLRAVEAKTPILQLFFSPELFLGSNETALIDKITSSGAEIFRCSEAVFRKIAYRDRPDGLLAIAPQKQNSLEDLENLLKNNTSPFLLVAEAIEKPGNLGTILRSADAAGVDALILCDRCTDIFNPNVVRASVGTLFSIPIIESSSSEALEWLKKQKITIAAATPHAKQEFTQSDLTGPIAIAVGTEQLGLSDLWMNEAQKQVKIPMKGIADSLNVATATTLLIYEALRQRQQQCL